MSEQNNDTFDANLDRIAEQVDAIAHFCRTNSRAANADAN